MRVTAALVGSILWSTLLLADYKNIDFDHHTDFSTFKTFALHEGKVDSHRPELNNPLVVKKLGDAIRDVLKSKGLKETTSSPDLFVEYSIAGTDYAAGRGGRGGPPTLSEGTLVIDLIHRDSKALVWRGVYHDEEKNNAKLAQKLPGDVKKFLSEYPPKQTGAIEPPSAFVPKASATAPIDFKAAAVAALDIIQSARKDESYLGPANHPGLSISLGGVERAARSVSDDDGRNPSTTKMRNDGFLKALQDAANYALEIANRPVETPADKDKSRALSSKLRALYGS